MYLAESMLYRKQLLATTYLVLLMDCHPSIIIINLFILENIVSDFVQDIN